MKNTDLLLMGGNPYPDATHWLTVAKGEKNGVRNYGYSTTAPGNILPNTLGSYTITAFYEEEYAGAEGTFSFFVMDANTSNIYIKVRATNLITGATGVSGGYLKDTDNIPLGLKDFVGQTIPLKIEVV